MLAANKEGMRRKGRPTTMRAASPALSSLKKARKADRRVQEVQRGGHNAQQTIVRGTQLHRKGRLLRESERQDLTSNLPKGKIQTKKGGRAVQKHRDERAKQQGSSCRAEKDK